MAGRLDGKIAVITGGCSGIGLGAVELFVHEGAKVAVGDIQDDKGADLEARFKGDLIYRNTDVTNAPAIKALIDGAAEEFGGLDIVFNNAGAGGGMGRIDDVSVEAWDWTFELLTRSVAMGTQYAIPHLEKRGGGSIINTGSIAGVQAGWGPIAYSSAKAAVVHFSKVAAMELAQRKIRVNAICPGLIATSIFGSSMGMGRQVADQMASQIATEYGQFMQALPVAGEPSAIANTALFLASDDSYFVTGQHIIVDGGITSGHPHSWSREGPSPLAALAGLSEEEAEARMEKLRLEQTERLKAERENR